MYEKVKQNYELAEADFKSGMKYKDIAQKYQVSLSAVKSWASRYWKKGGCNQEEKKLQPKRKKVATRGAPIGNKNAQGNPGGSAPVGNKNAVKTGEFETIFFDTLEEEERQLIQSIQLDKEELLLHEIQLLTIRERRMLKRIEGIKQSLTVIEDGKQSGMILAKRSVGIDRGEMTDIAEYEGALAQIQAIEDSLTRVQARKQKSIDSLHRFGFDDSRLQIELMRTELAMLKVDSSDTVLEDDGFLEAMNLEAATVWANENA